MTPLRFRVAEASGEVASQLIRRVTLEAEPVGTGE